MTNTNHYHVLGNEFDDVWAYDNCGIVTKLVNEYGVATLADLQLHIGENSITWVATDDNGNTSTSKFYVTVIDNEPPVRIADQLNTTTDAFPVTGCSAVVNYTAPVFTDYGKGISSITVNPSWAIPGATFPVGVTDVTYVAADIDGNTTVYTFSVTVHDHTLPTITCPVGTPFNKNADVGKKYYTTSGTEFNPTAFDDNCPPL